MKYFLFILFIPVLLVGQNSNQESDFSYFPIKVGNIWEFTNPTNDFSQKISVDEYSNEKYIISLNNYISNLSPIKNIEVYEFQNNMLLISASQGIYDDKLKEYFSKPIKLKIPLAVNQSWDYDLNGKKYECKVIKKHKSVITPYGTFKDIVEIQEKIIDGSFIAYKFNYYAKNIGLIKVEMSKRPESKREVIFYLKEFIIN